MHTTIIEPPLMNLRSRRASAAVSPHSWPSIAWCQRTISLFPSLTRSSLLGKAKPETTVLPNKSSAECALRPFCSADVLSHWPDRWSPGLCRCAFLPVALFQLSPCDLHPTLTDTDWCRPSAVCMRYRSYFRSTLRSTAVHYLCFTVC